MGALVTGARVSKSGTNGGRGSSSNDGRTTCWLRRYEDRRGVFPPLPAGGVEGGVGSPPVNLKVSAKASTEALLLGIRWRSDGSKGVVSSTITMDLLPVVIAMSLTGRCLCSCVI